MITIEDIPFCGKPLMTSFYIKNRIEQGRAIELKSFHKIAD
jgi:hypothetical protein